ncbi:MAG: serine hydrolase [Acetobacteraceae bacterium]|nr:serine hydrolase [Acetobacteraceae bacterium]
MNLGLALRRRVLGCVALCLLLGGLCGTARAQIGSDRYASIVVDAQSGQIISAANPDEYRFPASLTKMMTIYMVFEAIRDGRLSFTDMVPVSAWAASMPPTKLGLVPGTALTVEQAILGLVTKSANDAAAALGELLGGDEDRFAQLMTVRAHALGMTRTTFRNASGLPDWGQVTTARDLVVLARHLLQDFPQYYHYFSTPSFVFHRHFIPNHQTLLRTYAGADGLKTGYTEASGYNVVTSALRGDVRLIGVVLGASSGWERDQHMSALLDQGFARLGVGPVQVAQHFPSLIGSAHAAPALRPVALRPVALRPVVLPPVVETPMPARRGHAATRAAAPRGAAKSWSPPAVRRATAPEPYRAVPRARHEPARASRQVQTGRYPG